MEIEKVFYVIVCVVLFQDIVLISSYKYLEHLVSKQSGYKKIRVNGEIEQFGHSKKYRGSMLGCDNYTYVRYAVGDISYKARIQRCIGDKVGEKINLAVNNRKHFRAVRCNVEPVIISRKHMSVACSNILSGGIMAAICIFVLYPENMLIPCVVILIISLLLDIALFPLQINFRECIWKKDENVDGREWL